jgi:hypothetical protein
VRRHVAPAGVSRGGAGIRYDSTVRFTLVAALLLAAAPAFAAQAYAVSVEELARSSDAVVRGKVAGVRSWRTEDGRRVFTTYDVRTTAVLRGRAPSVARVTVAGGVAGGLDQRVDAAPALAPGEELVVFLRAEPGHGFTVTGLAQGKFSVAGKVARPDLSQLSFVRTTVPAGERRAEEMPLVELVHRVRSTR